MAETANIAVIDGESIADVSPWEFGSVVEDAGNGFELSSNAAIHGLKGYKASFGGTNDRAYGTGVFAEQTILYGRTYFNFPSSGYPFRTEEAFRDLYCFYFLDGGVEVAILRLQANNTGIKIHRVYYRDDGGQHYNTYTTSVTLDASHYFDMYYKNGAGSGAFELLFDGVSIMAVDDLTISYKPDTMLVGMVYSSNNPASGEYFYIDDILISTTGPLGSYKKWWAPIVESDTIAGLATAAETELNDNYTLTSGTVPQIAAYRGLENNFQGCLLFHGQEV